MPLYIQRHGQEAAREVAEFELAHIEAIQGVIHKEGINDCDLFLTKNTNVYFDEDRATSATHAIESLRQQGCKFVDQIQFIPAEKIETVRHKTLESVNNEIFIRNYSRWLLRIRNLASKARKWLLLFPPAQYGRINSSWVFCAQP